METGNAEVRGTVHGRTIEVDRDLGLRDGQQVTLVVKADPLLPEDAAAILRRVAGSWADEGPEFDEYLRTCREELPGERPDLEP